MLSFDFTAAYWKCPVLFSHIDCGMSLVSLGPSLEVSSTLIRKGVQSGLVDFMFCGGVLDAKSETKILQYHKLCIGLCVVLPYTTSMQATKIGDDGMQQ